MRIIDSGASDHMTRLSGQFFQYKPCVGRDKVRIADDSFTSSLSSYLERLKDLH